MPEQSKEPTLVSTGDIDNPTPVSKAILGGYAPGGELYVYSEYPEISYQDLIDLREADFPTVFHAVTRKLLGDAIPDEVQRAIAEEAYSEDNFDFGDDGNLRFTTLPSGIHVVGLSDGPTGAFKDMAMQPFARWMNYLHTLDGERLTILLSTTGDTGPAALSAFHGLEDTEIIGMMPEHGVSRFQWSQMAELAEEEGVHILEVAGAFSYINDIHMDADKVFELGAANSVNIARIIAQTAYHVAAYLKAIKLEGGEVGDPVDVSIPSGNFGNALSAIMARKMGLPLREIIVATNENNTLDRLISESVLQLSEFQATDSSAQDVEMPSNVWRYFALLYGNDTEKIRGVFEKYEASGSVNLEDYGVVDESVQEGVVSTTISGEDRARTIKEVYDSSDPNHRTIVDPHTANGLAAIDKLQAQETGVPILSMETAQPFKFNETISRILGIEPPRPDRFVGLEQRQLGKQLTRITGVEELLEYLRENTQAKAKV